ncbi:short-chain dehydrogenase/reductase SDR [Entophlyctis helioformis]|nr:short-chain dehydrogenase/reductase SDR [Entophlyctis helioformis]
MASASAPATALVTGANRGIGLALVKALLAKHYTSIDALRALFGTDRQLDLLVNNAGVFIRDVPDGVQAAADCMVDTFKTNAVGPLLVTQALMPNLALSPRPVVLNVSSQMGSIANTKTGGSVAYRASKAALNMVNKSLSVTYPAVTFLTTHPGYVSTGMSLFKGEISPEHSADCLLKIVDAADLSYSGKFFHYEGHELPW